MNIEPEQPVKSTKNNEQKSISNVDFKELVALGVKLGVFRATSNEQRTEATKS